MHICFLGGRMPITTERRGAIERLTVNLAAELSRRGHDVTIITVGEPPLDQYNEEGITFVEITEPIERPPSHVLPVREFGKIATDKVSNLHSKQPIDILHSVFYPTLLSFERPKEVPLVVTEHNAHPWRKEHQYIEDLTISHRARWEADTYIRLLEAHLSFRKADRIFSVSDAQGDWIDRAIPEFRHQRGRLYNYVDVNKFHPGANQDGVILPEQSTILYAGRKVPHKGLHRAVAALGELNMDVHLAILGPAGSGFTDSETLEDANTDEFDPYLKRVLRIAEKRGVADRVSFTGYVPDEVLPGYYAEADIVVFPSVLESFGLVPIEAMACSTPVVAHNLPPMTETIIDGETGFLTERTAESIAGSVERLLENPEMAESYGEAGREHVVENFSLEGQTTAHLRQYRDVR